jgi:outer membrane receptor protein involved in Fe transport
MVRAGWCAALSLALTVSLALPPGVSMAQSPVVRTFQISPQPVSSALRTFAEQAQVQLIFSDQDVRSLVTPGVKGVLSPQDALEKLLSGTSLQFEFTTRNVAVVRRTSAAAAARDAGSRLPPSPRQGGAEPVPAAAPIDEVIVTGSRIARRDFEANSPIFTVEATAFEEASTLAVESVLNQLPQFVPTGMQFVTNNIFPTATSTPGVATLNLRGLATNRTLVLIDGRRAQPANSTLVIDMNSIPSSAISRVEVITGGASATYGADAMGGVTNFKLRDNFEGATFELRSGITEAGDGEESRVSSLLGASSPDGRGNVMLGVEWTKRSAATYDGRPFFEDAWTDPGSLATAVRIDFSAYEPNATAGGLPSQAAVNALFPQRPAGANVSRNTPFYVNHDTTLFKDAGALGYTGELGQKFKVQPNGVLGENNLAELASSPLTRYAVLARGHYVLGESLNFAAQATFSNTQVQSVAQPSGATSGFAASIPRDSEHPVPAQLATLLDSRGPNVLATDQFDPDTGEPIVLTGADANWRLGRPLDFLPPRQLRNISDIYQLLVGFDGRLPLKDWTWEAYATHGQSRIDNEYIGFASLERYQAVVESANYGRGYAATGLGQTRASCTSGLPIFEQFQVSQDCIDAITIAAADRTRLSQDVVETNFQGAAFTLPAGDARAALGATYRKNEFDFRPDAIRESNSIFDIAISTFSNARVLGSTSVKEVYGELLLPILSGRRFAESLEFELGARYSDYDTAGGVPTYKALFSWAPIESVRFRGGYQVANRAPNINELFLTQSSVPVTLRGPDPCRSDTRDANGNRADNPNRARVQALCSAIIGTGTSTFDDDPNNFIGDGRTDGGEIERRSGSTAVKSEEGTTWTLGVVFHSPFAHALARGLRVTVDWYRAKVTEAIAQVGAQTTYDLCFNRDGISNPTYSLDDPNGMCRAIVRDGVSGDRFYVNSLFANLGQLETAGVDVQAGWTIAPSDIGFENVPGSLSFDVAYNKLLTFKSQSFPTSPVRENEGTLERGGLYGYRALTTLRYAAPVGGIALKWHRLPSIRSINTVTDPNTQNIGAASYNLFDLSANWAVTPNVRASFGIDNLFDRAPNRVEAGPGNNGAGNTYPGYYDVLGRRYYAGLRLEF